MVIQHILFDRGGLNRAKQDPSRPQVVGCHAEIDDLADGGITQQLVGNPDGDFHRGLGGALISIGVIFFVPPAVLVLIVVVVLVVLGNATRLFSTIEGRAADIADFVCRFNIADRPLDLVVPDFPLLALVEPPHRPPRSNLCASPPISPPPALYRLAEASAAARRAASAACG